MNSLSLDNDRRTTSRWRSALAIAAGFLLALVLSRSVDIVLEGSGVFPTVEEQQAHGFDVVWMNLLALGYRMTFSALGGVLTAALSPAGPMRHVHLLAALSTVFALIANIAVAIVPATAGVLPWWFSAAIVLTTYPTIWFGGRLHTQRTQRPRS